MRYCSAALAVGYTPVEEKKTLPFDAASMAPAARREHRGKTVRLAPAWLRCESRFRRGHGMATPRALRAAAPRCLRHVAAPAASAPWHALIPAPLATLKDITMAGRYLCWRQRRGATASARAARQHYAPAAARCSISPNISAPPGRMGGRAKLAVAVESGKHRVARRNLPFTLPTFAKRFSTQRAASRGRAPGHFPGTFTDLWAARDSPRRRARSAGAFAARWRRAWLHMPSARLHRSATVGMAAHLLLALRRLPALKRRNGKSAWRRAPAIPLPPSTRFTTCRAAPPCWKAHAACAFGVWHATPPFSMGVEDGSGLRDVGMYPRNGCERAYWLPAPETLASRMAWRLARKTRHASSASTLAHRARHRCLSGVATTGTQAEGERRHRAANGESRRWRCLPGRAAAVARASPRVAKAVYLRRVCSIATGAIAAIYRAAPPSAFSHRWRAERPRWLSRTRASRCAKTAARRWSPGGTFSAPGAGGTPGVHMQRLPSALSTTNAACKRRMRHRVGMRRRRRARYAACAACAPLLAHCIPAVGRRGEVEKAAADGAVDLLLTVIRLRALRATTIRLCAYYAFAALLLYASSCWRERYRTHAGEHACARLLRLLAADGTRERRRRPSSAAWAACGADRTCASARQWDGAACASNSGFSNAQPAVACPRRTPANAPARYGGGRAGARAAALAPHTAACSLSPGAHHLLLCLHYPLRTAPLFRGMLSLVAPFLSAILRRSVSSIYRSSPFCSVRRTGRWRLAAANISLLSLRLLILSCGIAHLNSAYNCSTHSSAFLLFSCITRAGLAFRTLVGCRTNIGSVVAGDGARLSAPRVASTSPAAAKNGV